MQQEFNGVIYHRYPGRLYYYSGRRGLQGLHQEVWKAAHGPIPEGHDIHHVNGNHDDNSLDNA